MVFFIVIFKIAFVSLGYICVGILSYFHKDISCYLFKASAMFIVGSLVENCQGFFIIKDRYSSYI